MGKMFITKYPDIINNDNLLTLGQLKFQFTNAGGGSLSIAGTTYSDGTNTKSISDGTTAIIENKYELTSLRCNETDKGFATTTLTLKDLKFSTKLTVLYYPGAAYLGDESERNLSNLKDLINLREINLQDLRKTKDIIGDISSLSNMTQLTYINLERNHKVIGNISSWSKLTNLIDISLNGTNISGDISSLSNLKNLTGLRMTGSKVHGDISSIVTNLTKLTQLGIPSTITITDAQKKTLTDRGCTVVISDK